MIAHQPTLFEHAAAARAAREAGMERAEAAEMDWSERADRAIAHLASTGRPFSPDDVRDLVGDPAHPNAMGGRFMAAVRRRQIERCGWAPSRRESCHAHTGPLYRGVG
jgi:hypothetical protein